MDRQPHTESIAPIPYNDSNIVNAAEGEDAEYHFVGEEEHGQVCLDAIKQAVSKGQMCALNCQGESLSRKGSIKLLSIATREKYFILDIQKLNALPFERGLREILEDKNVIKLMFDCREDADALFHQFHVTLDGVLDIQLLEVLKRPVFVGKTINRKTEDHTLGAICLNSLLECIKTYVKSGKIDEQREDGMELKKESVKRHLSDEQIQYVKTDVMSLFSLFDFFYPNDEEIKRLKIASQIYVDLKRSIPSREYSEFKNNKYLPVDVIPDKGSLCFPRGIVSCTACHRLFPRDAFSNKQLKKHKHMCKTCKKVKNDMDVRRVRLKNYEKKEREEVVRKYTFGPCECDKEYESAEREDELREYQSELCDIDDDYKIVERELGEHLYEICDRKDEYERLEKDEELREIQYEFCDDCSDSYDEYGRVEINKEKYEYTYAFYESDCDSNDGYDRLERKEELREYKYYFCDSYDIDGIAEREWKESREFQYWFCDNYDKCESAESEDESKEFQCENCDSNDEIKSADRENETNEYEYEFCDNENAYESAERWEIDEYQYEVCDGDDEKRKEFEKEISEYLYQLCPNDDEIVYDWTKEQIMNFMDRYSKSVNEKKEEKRCYDYDDHDEYDKNYDSDYEPYDRNYDSDYEPYDSNYGSDYEPYDRNYGSDYEPYDRNYDSDYEPYDKWHGSDTDNEWW